MAHSALIFICETSIIGRICHIAYLSIRIFTLELVGVDRAVVLTSIEIEIVEYHDCIGLTRRRIVKIKHCSSFWIVYPASVGIWGLVTALTPSEFTRDDNLPIIVVRGVNCDY